MGDPTYILITSRGAFLDALRTTFESLATHGGRHLFLSDPDFAEWPLGERAVVDSLTRWAQPYRTLTLLATHYDEVARRHARWGAWRQSWSHIVNCQAADEADVSAIQTQLFIPGKLVLRLVDRASHRGSVSTAENDLIQAQEGLDAILQRSQPSFPATTLGL